MIGTAPSRAFAVARRQLDIAVEIRRFGWRRISCRDRRARWTGGGRRDRRRIIAGRRRHSRGVQLRLAALEALRELLQFPGADQLAGGLARQPVARKAAWVRRAEFPTRAPAPRIAAALPLTPRIQPATRSPAPQPIASSRSQSWPILPCNASGPDSIPPASIMPIIINISSNELRRNIRQIRPNPHKSRIRQAKRGKISRSASKKFRFDALTGKASEP